MILNSPGGYSQGFGIDPRVLECSQGFGIDPRGWECY